jgi:hypothetical protein
MVATSNAQAVASRSTPKGSLEHSGHAPANQVLRTARLNRPGTGGFRIGQRVARNRLAAKAPAMPPPGLRTQPGFDIAQRLSVGLWGKAMAKIWPRSTKILFLIKISREVAAKNR